MANKVCLYTVDALLRLLCNADKLFGSKYFISISDFCQVAPVVRGSSLGTTIDISIWISDLWPSFALHKLE